MNWVSPAKLILIHSLVIAETGGLNDVLNPGAVESALARPFTTYGGVDSYVGLLA